MSLSQKILILVLAITFNVVADDNNENVNLDGINSLPKQWTKLSSHNRELVILDECGDGQEGITISSIEGKHMLTYTHNGLSKSYDIKKCAIRTSESSSEVTYDIELINLKNSRSSSVVVKLFESKSVWYGLTTRVSSDAFAPLEHADQFRKIEKDCE